MPKNTTTTTSFDIDFDSVLTELLQVRADIINDLDLTEIYLDKAITKAADDINVNIDDVHTYLNTLEGKLDAILTAVTTSPPSPPVDSVSPPVDSVAPPIDSVIQPPVDSVVIPPSDSTITPLPDRYKVAWNLNEASYWQSNIVFRNLLRQAQYRDDFTIDGKNPTLLFWETEGKGADFPRTGYQLLNDPDGSWKFVNQGIAIFTSEDAVAEGVEFVLDNAGPGFFHKDYIESLKNAVFIRFMDWFRTNHSNVVTYTQLRNRAQVPIRQCVRLANLANTIPWFCVPHMADDDCIRKFAEAVRDNLADNVPYVYVEYSNELWNPGFDQYNWLNFSSDMHKKWAEGLERVSDIWKQVLGNRVKVVLAGQTENIWHAKQVLRYINKSKIDVLSCAGYWDGHRTKWQGSVDATINQMDSDINNEERFWSDWKNYANGQGFGLIAYEGGFHTTRSAANIPSRNAFYEIHRHPRMYDLTKKAMNLADKYFDEFGWFNDVYVGGNEYAWGAKEYQYQPEAQAHKYRALMDFIRENT